MTFSPTSRQIVLQEVFDEASIPTDEEIHDYALKIGINVETEPHLLYLARDGLMEALPPGWKPCYDEERKEIYYFNFKTVKAQWEHPLDEVYRNLVKKARNESNVNADQVDDDSRTSIKEDLKSFEEASLILPSSEMYPKPKVLDPLSPLGLGAFKKSPTALVPLKKSSSKELLKNGILKLPAEVDEDVPATKHSENEMNLTRKITFDEMEVRKRPNSSDIRNRRNIGPVEFRHLSKQEVIIPKHFGKSSFNIETKKLSELSRLNDIRNIENKAIEISAVAKDEGYATEFSMSSLGEKENEMRGNSGKKELTLTGGGSIFLKSNKNKFSPSSDLLSLSLSKEESSEGLGSSLDYKKSSSDIESHSKGILREQSFSKLNEKPLTFSVDEPKILIRKNSEEDRKSVRFNLEKDIKVNFELPQDYRTLYDDNPSLDGEISKKSSLSVRPQERDTVGKTKQIEIDFEDLEVDFGESFTGDTHKSPVVEEKKMSLISGFKTVKPKKFKSSQTLVQEFREIFEVKNKAKINIPISSPLKIDEAATHPQELKGNIENNSNHVEYEINQSDQEKASSASENKITDHSGENVKSGLHNLIDLSDLEETKDSSSAIESQKEFGKTDRSYGLKDDIFDSDFAGLVDFALKRNIFENGSSLKSDLMKDAPTPKKRSVFKEKNILDEILKMDENEISNNRLDDKLQKEDILFNLKSDSGNFEKKSEEADGKYEKKKNEKLKNLEANFNEWLSETEKLFEEKKSNALIKMKEKFEDWKANRESEFDKMYTEKREEETQNRFKELKNEFLKKDQEEIDKLKEMLEMERKAKLTQAKMQHEKEMEKEIARMKMLLEERLKDEKSNLMKKQQEELERLEKNWQEIVSEKQSQKKKELEIMRESKMAVEAMELELRENYQRQKMSLIREHELLLDNLRQQHAVALENLRVEFRNEEEAVRKFHSDRLDEIRMKLTAVEAKKLELTESQKPDVGETRIYEKVRCEKRLLEDKYKTLKEKYVRLKSEAKSTLDRKHKKDVAATGSETEKSSSNKSGTALKKSDCESSNSKRNQENDKKVKLKKPFANLDNFNQNTSTEEEENILSSKNTSSILSQSEMKKSKKSPDLLIKNKKIDGKLFSDIGKDGAQSGIEFNASDVLKKNHSNETKKKRQLFSRLKAASTSRINAQNWSQDKESPVSSVQLSPVENLRRQLKKLEELEDQFPVTTHTDTYMRYPFTDIPQVGSSEIEFFKHRIHLERESVKRAKESLKAQKKSFENRQRELKQKMHEGGPEAKSVMEQVHQEERELTDMEVSVHRTRALLGEKIIRLRHLEQSLKRISEPRKKESFINKDILGRLGFRTQAKEEDRTLSDLSSHSGSSGFSSTDFNATDTHNAIGRGWTRGNVEESRRQFQNNMQESSEIIQSLENLNSEIREIWEVLKKQHESGQTGAILLPPPPLMYGDAGWPTFSLTPPMAFRNTVITSNANVERSVAQQLKNQVSGNPNFVTAVVDSSLVDRTRTLRDWLKAARNSSATSGGMTTNQVTL